MQLRKPFQFIRSFFRQCRQLQTGPKIEKKKVKLYYLSVRNDRSQRKDSHSEQRNLNENNSGLFDDYGLPKHMTSLCPTENQVSISSHKSVPYDCKNGNSLVCSVSC